MYQLFTGMYKANKLSNKCHFPIHDENYRFTSVQITGDKVLYCGITVFEMHLDELPFAMCTMKHTPVNATKKIYRQRSGT